MNIPFHLAFPVHDLAAARAFYGGVLGCREGRSSDTWVDFDLYGHQIVAHLAPERSGVTMHNPVDSHNVPVPHFGVILTMAEWEALAGRLRTTGTRFVIEPYVRFRGEVGEQATMFFLDPSGNAIEIKAFADPTRIFARDVADVAAPSAGRDSPPDLRLAESVRAACLAAARQGYEDAAVSGLCGEGALEAAIGAIAMLDLDPVIAAATGAKSATKT